MCKHAITLCSIQPSSLRGCGPFSLQTAAGRVVCMFVHQSLYS